MVSLNEYFAMLSNHDWEYDQDNKARFDEGIKTRKRIQEICDLSAEHKKMYNDWFSYKLKNGPIPIFKVEVIGTATGES